MSCLGQEANTERRQLVDLLQLATNESVPVATRQKLAENVLQLFDQRNQIVVRLLQVSYVACIIFVQLFMF